MDVLWLRISCLGWFCNQEELGKKEEEERCCAETAVLTLTAGRFFLCCSDVLA